MLRRSAWMSESRNTLHVFSENIQINWNDTVVNTQTPIDAQKQNETISFTIYLSVSVIMCMYRTGGLRYLDSAICTNLSVSNWYEISQHQKFSYM